MQPHYQLRHGLAAEIPQTATTRMTSHSESHEAIRLVVNKQRRLVVLLLLILCSIAATRVAGQTPVPSPSVEQTDAQRLQTEKLREEIRKLQLENDRSASTWNAVLSYSTLITGLVAVGGLIATFWKQIKETGRQRELDRQQREKEQQEQERNRIQREAEARQRLDDKFTAIVTQLGSESPSLQASAAVSILGFLKPDYSDFHNQVFLILLANLKVQHNDKLAQNETLSGLLITAFQQAIRTQVPDAVVRGDRPPLDLSRCCMNRIDLSGLDLTGVDVAFSELKSANLTDSILFRARGFEAHLERARLSRSNLGEARLRKAYLNEAQLHEAILTAADLKEADLTNAQFQNAGLQSAHLERSNLTGARFEQANLNDAFFQGATFSEATLKSIIKAFKWQQAHFDQAILDRLNDSAAQARAQSQK